MVKYEEPDLKIIKFEKEVYTDLIVVSGTDGNEPGIDQTENQDL